MSPPKDPARYMRERRAKNPRFVLEANLAKYGLTVKQFDDLVQHQGGACAVCERPPQAGQRLHVDHDHETGVVRALLCGHCNAAVGFIEESVDRVWQILGYVEYCIELRKTWATDPVRYAMAQAYKQSASIPRRRQVLLEAEQRLRDHQTERELRGRRWQKVAEILDDVAASNTAVPEVAAVRAGAAHDAVFV